MRGSSASRPVNSSCCSERPPYALDSLLDKATARRMPGDELEMPGDEHKNISSWPWSPEEDTIILQMHSQLGPMWSKMVRRLPGRTVSSVRNR